MFQHQLDEATAHEEDMAAKIEALESELAATNVCDHVYAVSIWVV